MYWWGGGGGGNDNYYDSTLPVHDNEETLL